MNKPNNKKSIKKNSWSKKKIVGVVSGSIVGLYVLSLFVPFISPFSWYPIYFAKCGKQPVVASDFAAGDTYDVPGDKNYNVDIFTSRFFCTEAEAQAAWYHHNPLDK